MSLIDQRTKAGRTMVTAIGVTALIVLVRLIEHWAELCVFISALSLAWYVMKRHSSDVRVDNTPRRRRRHR